VTPSREALAHLHERTGAPDPYGAIHLPVPGGSCRLEVSAGLPDTLWISKISLPEHLRGQGHGNRIMRELIDLASEHGCAIGLEAFWNPAEEDGGQLIRFYRRLGFEEEGMGDQGYMELICPAQPPHRFEMG